MTSMRALPLFSLVGLVALSGCSLLHSNINGGFACAAPKGTCAPSTMIDDSALKAIGGGEASDARQGENREREPAARTQRESTSVAGMRPALRIVYPAWRDADGHVHPRTSAYAPVEAPRLEPADVIAIDVGKLGASGGASLLSLAESAPDMSLLTAAPTDKPAPVSAGQDGSPKAAAMLAGQVPIPVPVPAGKSPIDAIKDAVKDILSGAPKPQFTPPATAPAPLPAKAGVSFPPSGS